MSQASNNSNAHLDHDAPLTGSDAPQSSDGLDRGLDQHLRSVDWANELPEAPSGADIRARAQARSGARIGQSSVEHDQHHQHHQAILPSRSRRPRWLAAGSALAACLGVAAIVFTTIPKSSRVQASTIIQSMRQASIKGVNVRMTQIAYQGITLDAQVMLRSNRTVTIDELAAAADSNAPDPAGGPAPPSQPLEFKGIYAQAHFRTDASFAEFPGVDFTIESAFSPDVGWVFVKSDPASIDAIADRMPQIRALASLGTGGVLVNVGPLNEALLHSLEPVLSSQINTSHNLDDMSDDEIASSNEASANFDQMTGASGSPRPQVVAQTDANGRRTVTLSARIGTQAGAQAAGAHTSASAPVGATFNAHVGNAGDAINAIPQRMLRGTATQADIEQLRNALTNLNQSARVENLGCGQYMLHADLNDTEHPDQGTQASIKVLYQEQQGVQWAEFGNFREAAGTLRIEFASDDIDPALLDPQRLVQVGQTGFIDAQSILRLLGGR